MSTSQHRSAPRVSVIIPTYNRAHYITRAIDSALQQTCPGVEVIVVDDGSSDDTGERVAAYGDRVRYIPTFNGGVARARNVGMSHAQGEFITFLDSDDLLYPYSLEVESRMLDLYPDIGMVYAEMSAFSDDGFFDRYHLKTYHQSAYRDPRVTYGRLFDSSVRLGDLDAVRATLEREDPALLDRRAYFGNIFDAYLLKIFVFQNNMLMRRSVFASIGLRNERVKHFQELEYILRITRKYRVGFVDVPTYKLRYHPGQISSTGGPNGRAVWVRKQRELLRVVKRHALLDAAYYEQHRSRVNKHLSNLHRAVAVPLMLADGPARRSRECARRARKYLARCSSYGYPHRSLWLMTFGPAAVRRFAVSMIEYGRCAGYWLASRASLRQA